MTTRVKASSVARLLMLGAFVVTSGGRVAEGARRTPETARALIAALPAGALIDVKLTNGERIIGTLGCVTSDSFSIYAPHSDEARTLRYQDTKVAKAARAAKNWKPSWKWWIVIGAAMTVLIVLAVAASGGSY